LVRRHFTDAGFRSKARDAGHTAERLPSLVQTAAERQWFRGKGSAVRARESRHLARRSGIRLPMESPYRPQRRQLLGLLSAAALSATGRAPRAADRSRPPRAKLRGVAFDLFTILDPRSVVAAAETVVPAGRAQELCDAWRLRQFEYSWLRTAAGRYVDFRTVTEESLAYAAKAAEIALSADARRRTFKPDPRAYALGVSVLGLRREEIAFAAFGGWDAAGAAWYGYPTFWVDRLGLPVEELAPGPDATGRTLRELAAWIATR
jgi:hypothetical protein